MTKNKYWEKHIIIYILFVDFNRDKQGVYWLLYLYIKTVTGSNNFPVYTTSNQLSYIIPNLFVKTLNFLAI